MGHPFYQHGLTLIQAWIDNEMRGKVWVKFRIHSQNSTAPLLKFGKKNSTQTL